MNAVVVVDAANVVGSRPDGWWKDRAAATRRLHEALLVGDVPGDEIIMVLEGGARGGARPGKDAHVRIVHAPKEGDVTILAEAQRAAKRGCTVTVVTADLALGANAAATGATVVGPSWLLDHLEQV
ncbi:hypothetical protein I601_2526 [Nocardioides dokdonensis FR1436]|uniref:YacP-like NYN domain protein n=1 Tax=Nocardioides dokdonensis FR1436 TaxID=1300347 RepID=A0A1A9GMQ0_9ACTN|nr:hypothetical protein [Nocardioides dokdonensis]ANH38942.1 hypothetical protein I601_2526 [Nocardioides dokdonensis FR1436]